MKIYFLIACLCISLSIKAQTDVPVDVPGIGYGATSASSTFRFDYLGKPVAHYGLGWYSENGTPSAYLSGYAGLKFFTSGGVKMMVGADGNVGIGTTNATTPLFVNGGSSMTNGWNKTATLRSTYPVLIFNSSDAKWAGLGYDNSSGFNLWVNAASDDLPGTGNIPFHVSNAGDISLGNGNAAFKLNVNGEADFTKYLRLRSNDQEMQFYRDGSVYGYLWSSSNGLHWGKGSGSNSITIDNSGNTGIGITDPKGYKLAVNGKIRAQEIKVEASPWPDYVFASDYQLPTLQETEKHIKDKGHLPGIPSAAEVKANGIDLGEMNAKLLQKIEELTLHLIEQNNRNQKQDAIIAKQQNEINQLKNKLSIP
ncbi:hypothetical protein [Pedobacter africanus]|uniref:Uncharacterized protein n=1 Tax=Pedobacter africanus TaxID=151894 RepID=A0A1W2BQL5_9SPHI|nr:hypothetical protein [Pedobacter africanus]SMC75151.1 hypothetical protein SAMN04488524_2556 [Pedobacter africanus]